MGAACCKSKLWRRVYLNCWTILVQTHFDYLGGWRMQFVVVVGFFPTHIYFSSKKEVFSVHGSVISSGSTSTVP